jgi:hypothetical protein
MPIFIDFGNQETIEVNYGQMMELDIKIVSDGSSDHVVELPLNEYTNVAVDWGHGTESSKRKVLSPSGVPTSDILSHSYPDVTADYTIKICVYDLDDTLGSIPHFGYRNINYKGSQYITEIRLGHTRTVDLSSSALSGISFEKQEQIDMGEIHLPHSEGVIVDPDTPVLEIEPAPGSELPKKLMLGSIAYKARITTPQIMRDYYAPGVVINAPLQANNPTIVVVLSYINPSIYDDMNLYCAKMGVPPLNNVSKGESDPRYANFTIYYQSGDAKTFSTTPRAMMQSDYWYKEMCIDVQTAHGMAPYADLILVCANSGSDLLFQAMDFGMSLAPKVNVVSVSCSFGGGETASANDAITAVVTKHPEIIVCAGTGDSNTATRINYPSCNPNVLAVGATSYPTDNIERAYCYSTSGVSAFIPKPDYQKDLVKYSTRTVPDLSLNGDNSTGVTIFTKGVMFAQVGGTSVSAPIMAGFIALLVQKYMLDNKICSRTSIAIQDFHNLIYSNPAVVRDITQNSLLNLKNNIWTNINSAGAGFDVCGLGSPLFASIYNAVKFTVTP